MQLSRFSITLFLIILSTSFYSNDSCEVSFFVKCPKSDLKYWSNFASIKGENEKLKLLEKKKKLFLPQGKYKFSLYSEFGDAFDTTIILNKNKMNITLTINQTYIFEKYSNSILEAEGDTISINYEKKFCSGGGCVRDRDRIELYKTSNGQYFARYYSNIITGENCIEATETAWSDKLISSDKNENIKTFFASKNIPYDTKRVREFTVKIGRKIFAMENGAYEKFRKELLD